MALELRLAPPDMAALEREHATNLVHGRALVGELAAAEVLDAATLVLVRPSDGAELALSARIVMLLPDGPVRGTALELDLSREGVRDGLARFVAGEPAAPPLDAPTTSPFDDVDRMLESAGPDVHADEPECERPVGDPRALRIRKLSAAERLRTAREGGLEDRVALERAFGKAVWEELLRNPQITVPEVARIAAKGTAPRALLEQIADHAAWSRQPIVRRALLANPRVSADGVLKLLRATPKPELKLLVQTAAYPAAVRAAAKKLLE